MFAFTPAPNPPQQPPTHRSQPPRLTLTRAIRGYCTLAVFFSPPPPSVRRSTFLPRIPPSAPLPRRFFYSRHFQQLPNESRTFLKRLPALVAFSAPHRRTPSHPLVPSVRRSPTPLSRLGSSIGMQATLPRMAAPFSTFFRSQFSPVPPTPCTPSHHRPPELY